MKIIGCILIALFTVIVCWVVYTQIREHYDSKDTKLAHLKNICKDLHPDFKNVKLYRGDKSYTINKEKIYLCLYDPDGNYYDDNMLIYVLIHEFAHKLNQKDVGHTEEFNRIFEELLAKAEKMGIYDSSKPIIDNYCP